MDATVTTAQLEAVFIDFMKEVGHTTLYCLFSELEMAADWNSAPGKAVQAISNLYPFYVKILQLCPNGVLPRARMRHALINLDEKRDCDGLLPYKWNFETRSTVDAAHAICETIRVGASKLRDLKQCGKRYIHSMIGQSWEVAKKVDELIAMITLANSPHTEAMVVARQYSYVDDTGCCMEIFDRVLTGAITRPLRYDSSNESLVQVVEEDPGVDPTDMRSSEDVAEKNLDTQPGGEWIPNSGSPASTPASVNTNDAPQVRQEGVNTDLASTSVVSEQPPMTPHLKTPPQSGSELDLPSNEKATKVANLGKQVSVRPEPAKAQKKGTPKKGTPKKMVDTWNRHFVTKKQNVGGPVKPASDIRPPVCKKAPKTTLQNGSNPRTYVMWRAYKKAVYKKAVRAAKAKGWTDRSARLSGRRAYANAKMPL